MSASREKKQRQAVPAEGISQKRRKEAEEAAKQKRKTRLYVAIGVVAAVIAAGLLIWNSNLVQKPAVAAVVDGREYSTAEMSYYYQNVYTNYYRSNYYSMLMGMDIGFDFNQPASAQIYSEATGKTWQEYFQDQALEQVRQISALNKAAADEGFTMTEYGQSLVDSMLQDLDSQALSQGMDRANYLKRVYGRFMTSSLYTQCVKEAALATDYAKSHEDSLTYSDAALNDYYKENADTLDTFHYDYAYFYGKAEGTKDADGKTVEPTEEESKAALDAAKEKADALAEAVKAGGDFEALATEAIGSDTSSSKGIGMENTGAAVFSTYRSWVTDASRKAGDVTVMEASGSAGYYVVRFNSRALVEDDFATVDFRHILIKAELDQKDDPATENVDESTVPSDAAMEAAKAKAQQLLDQWNSGDKSIESFAALANEHSDDPGSNTKGGLYTGSYRNNLVSGVGNWLFEEGRKEGDAGLAENTASGQQGWHVLYLEKLGLPTWKDTAVTALKGDDMEQWLKELTEPVTAEAADAMRTIGS